MVVWLKPCESRSSPGFTPKTPLLAQRGFSLPGTGSVGRKSTAHILRDRYNAWNHAIERVTSRAHSVPGHAPSIADAPRAVDCRATRATIASTHHTDERVATRPENQSPTTMPDAGMPECRNAGMLESQNAGLFGTGSVGRKTTADNLRDRYNAWTRAIERLTSRVHSDPGNALPNADTLSAVDCRATRATVTPTHRTDERVATRPGNQFPTSKRALL